MAFIIGGTAGAIIGAGAIGAAGNIASGIMGSNAASDAADGQLQAARETNQLNKQIWDEQRRMYEQSRDQQRADLDPWRQSGAKALSDLGNADFQRDFTAADFQKDPGYEFRMAEAQKAMERSAAAKGGLQSGGTLKALTRYSQGVASDEYQNAYNRFNADRDRRFGRLSSLANMGQSAAAGQANASANYAGQMGAAGSNYASNFGNTTMGAANAAGAAQIAGANAWGNTLSNIGRTAMDGVAMNQQGKWMDQWAKAQGKG